MSDDLAGTAVVVTRPADQAGELIEALRVAGATVIAAPGIEIEPLTEGPLAAEAAARLCDNDWVVFISRNAVRHGTGMLREWLGDASRWPWVAAVGPGTAEELARYGWPVDAAPRRGGGGDALLAQPDFSPGHGERVLIIRGEGGSAALAESLRARGVALSQLAVYRRRPAAVDPSVLQSGWQSADQRVTIVTSDGGIRALVANLPLDVGRELLRSHPVAISQRLAETARVLGFSKPPVVADGTGTRELVAAARRAAAEDEETP
jgi:uroporphyrinogen-III synthase